MFPAADIVPYIVSKKLVYSHDDVFTFVDYVEESAASSFSAKDGFVAADIPLTDLVPHLSNVMAVKVARHHKIAMGSHVPKKAVPQYFSDHVCNDCPLYHSIFRSKKVMTKQKVCKTKISPAQSSQPMFPPPPLSPELAQHVIRDFCIDSEPKRFEESGCAVCGRLTLLVNLSQLKSVKGMLNVLDMPGVTRIEHMSSKDHIQSCKGPVLDDTCKKICNDCRSSIRKGKVPEFALAKGLWIGKVPKELSDLRFIEKLLNARLRHNCCFVHVASGLRKMTSHVVAFQAPTPKLYHALPPPVEDISEVLAILFTGPTKPTSKDFERTPLLIQRNAVAKALEWLKLNHGDYSDLEISYKNLAEYPEDTPPVLIEYKESAMNKYPENTSQFDHESEDGTEEGACPFVVHGLTGDDLDTISSSRLLLFSK
jgi:hypothetical protein